MTTLDELFSGRTVMGIFRNADPAHSVRLATTAWDVGVDVVEIPVQSDDAFRSLEAVIAAGAARGKPVGAGTVTSARQVRRCRDIGAAFTVAPGFDPDVVSVSHDVGVPHLPGVATSTDIQAAVAAGCRWLKAFPASVLGPAWLTAQKNGPFPDVSFVATGGINAANATDFLSAGAAMVAIGSAFEDANQLTAIGRLLATPSPHSS